MKVAFILFFCLAVIADVYHAWIGIQEGFSYGIMEASIDRSLAYIVVTASLLGVIKLKKNPQ